MARSSIGSRAPGHNMGRHTAVTPVRYVRPGSAISLSTLSDDGAAAAPASHLTSASSRLVANTQSNPASLPNNNLHHHHHHSSDSYTSRSSE